MLGASAQRKRRPSSGSSASDGAASDQQRVVLLAQAERPAAAGFGRDPAALSPGGGDLAVEAHRPLERDLRSPQQLREHEAQVELDRLASSTPHWTSTPALAQPAEALTGGAGIRIDVRGDHAPHTGREHASTHGGVRPWCAHGSSVTYNVPSLPVAGLAQRDGLGVRFAVGAVAAASDDPPVASATIAPTIGLGPVRSRPRSASRRAARKWSSSTTATLHAPRGIRSIHCLAVLRSTTLRLARVDLASDSVVRRTHRGEAGAARGSDANHRRSGHARRGRVDADFQVNTYTGSSQIEAVVGRAASGAFVVAWQSANQDGQFYGIFAQRFDSAGAKIGVELQVNSYTTGTQSQPALAMNDGGAFVVVWRSGSSQDGSDYGVFGRGVRQHRRVRRESSSRSTRTPPDRQDFPVVAIDEQGDFVVAWQSADRVRRRHRHLRAALRLERRGAGGRLPGQPLHDLHAALRRDRERHRWRLPSSAGTAWESEGASRS